MLHHLHLPSYGEASLCLYVLAVRVHISTYHCVNHVLQCVVYINAPGLQQSWKLGVTPDNGTCLISMGYGAGTAQTSVA